jgi:hypothetical protein
VTFHLVMCLMGHNKERIKIEKIGKIR